MLVCVRVVVLRREKKKKKGNLSSLSLWCFGGSGGSSMTTTTKLSDLPFFTNNPPPPSYNLSRDRRKKDENNDDETMMRAKGPNQPINTQTTHTQRPLGPFFENGFRKEKRETYPPTHPPIFFALLLSFWNGWPCGRMLAARAAENFPAQRIIILTNWSLGGVMSKRELAERDAFFLFSGSFDGQSRLAKAAL